MTSTGSRSCWPRSRSDFWTYTLELYATFIIHSTNIVIYCVNRGEEPSDKSSPSWKRRLLLLRTLRCATCWDFDQQCFDALSWNIVRITHCYWRLDEMLVLNIQYLRSSRIHLNLRWYVCYALSYHSVICVPCLFDVSFLAYLHLFMTLETLLWICRAMLVPVGGARY
jgi:hypothetical protein